MTRIQHPSLRDIVLALLTALLLTVPVLAQSDAPVEPGEPPVESPAPPDPGEPIEDPEDEAAPEEPTDPEQQPDEPTDPADPDQDPDADMETPADADAVGVPAPSFGNTRLIEVPVESGMREFTDVAWLRGLNLSPNVGDVDFNLVYTDDESMNPSIPEFMNAVGYEGHGTYVELPAGNYVLNLSGLAEDELGFSVNGGRYYTLVVTGLELPPEAAEDNADEGGFMGWLRGIFGGDEDGDAYTLDLLLLEDDLYQTNLETDSLVRVVNAAPGTEAVTLAVTGESGTLTGSAAYGNATGNNRVNAAEFSGPLELRLAGARAATIPLEDVSLVPGTVNTVFLVGTPIEDAPLRALVLTTPSFMDEF